jgi:hypothetical protein
MWKVPLLSLVAAVLLLGGVAQAARDVTKPGDTIQGVPNNNDWPGNEAPNQAIDDQTVTKYLHYNATLGPTGIRVTPKAGATVVTGVRFCSANDTTSYPGRAPVTYELSGSNVSIDGPYTLISKGDIKDFAGPTVWPNFTWTTTPMKFPNTIAYKHYQLLFPMIWYTKYPGSSDALMQVAEIELLSDVFVAASPSPANGATGVLIPLMQWTPGDTAAFENVYFGTSPDLTAADLVKDHQSPMLKMYYAMQALTPGQTYYWRVDEIDSTGKVYPGDVWSFSVPPLIAFNPTPIDGDKWIDPNVDLSWIPGQGASKHNLYFGADQAKVAARDASVSKGTLSNIMTFDPGTLALKTTYYWVVDELVGTTTRAGDVWSFTTVGPNPGGAKGEYFNNTSLSGLPVLTRIDPTIDFTSAPGAPITAGNWSARWTADLEIIKPDTYMFTINCYSGTRMWIDGQLIIDKWVSPTVPSNYFSLPMSLAKGVHSLLVEYFCGGSTVAEQLSWSTATMAKVIVPAGPLQPPVHARAIVPADGDVNVPQDVTLTWSIGEKAATHDVYFGEDAAAVAAATPADTALYQGSQERDKNTFVASGLAWNQTYYWRVDEVNEADPESPWPGSVWSFTTADFIVVDNFESYTNDSPNRIFQTWIDGYGFSEDEFFPSGDPGNGTGSAVGHDIWATGTPYTSIAETKIVHTPGAQSMPFDYNNFNSPYYSETVRTWSSPQNWKANGVDTLVLYYQGVPPKFLQTATGYIMSAAGSDIYGGVDEFRFAYKRLSGDGSVTVRVDDAQTVNSWTKTGVMVRESLDPLAMQVHMIAAPQQTLVEWMYRNITGNTTTTQFNTASGSAPLPVWVRITRAGNVFTGEYSTNGTTWSKITQTDGTTSSVTIVMPATVYVGFVVCSHVANTVASATFSDIKTSGNVTGQWQTVDVGVTHPGNDAGQLYVVLQDGAGKSAVVKADPEAVFATGWTAWKIPLSQFTGVNVGTVKKMFIGVGDRSSPTAGGAGEIYIDDIRVIKP